MQSMTETSSRARVAAIVGVGPNLGRSIARKFIEEGYDVALMSRDTAKLRNIAEDIAKAAKGRVFLIRIDCSDSGTIRAAFEAVHSIGFVEVLVYNAYQPLASNPSRLVDIQVDDFEKSIAVSSVGALHCAQQVIPGMVKRGRGTIHFSGCSTSLSGIAGHYDLCCGKFALRGLAQCLTREFEKKGIHVAHIIINGVIGPPMVEPSTSRGGRNMDLDILAQAFWHLHTQDRAVWIEEITLSLTNRRFH